ncbi:glycoside hydrolase family 97 protein [Bacteroidales bacterium OttesenSCG-928-J19]|nr:glycoside hydrolase family 97 protein [Bacteroidales bacterium OttesenSCG-928-J19]
MKKPFVASIALLLSVLFATAQTHSVKSPDEQLTVSISLKEGSPVYNIQYKGQVMLEESPLGLVADIGDFSQGLQWNDTKINTIDTRYTLSRTKVAKVHYQANELIATFSNGKGQKIDIVFRVSNNDVAFRYSLPTMEKKYSCIIEKELTGFDFPQQTTTFLTPQALPMTGWEKTKPSYEEEYVPDEPMGTPSKYGVGYTFPALFHVGEKGWVLVSETGTGGNYCGTKLSEGTQSGLYRIAFPEPGENNGMGNVSPAITLPGVTPWRTLTVGDNLKPIVETTIPFDVVEPLYEPSQDYRFGRSVWSWIIWQDWSMNFEDQKAYVDLAAEMGYEYSLVDGLWDAQMGKKKLEELAKYAASKGVELFVWYNSNGHWNNAPQGPRNCMNNAIARKQEMAWMQSIGVKGIKVDFFGGDKQCTLQLYEDILSDANDYGILVIFHGCTLPRGWERMYPNFVGSEAVLASENLVFTQHANDTEAYNACLHPFIRNTVGSMDFGPVLLQKRHNRDPEKGQFRRTSETFQLATAILFQASVQNFAVTPYNLTTCADFVIDFMKAVPTTWDETVFIDGYPGKYCILARRHGDAWYVAGINAEAKEKKIKVNLPMLAGQTVALYSDKKDLSPQLGEMKINNKGEVSLTIQPNGAVMLTSKRVDK